MAIPLETPWGLALSTFLTAFGIAGLPTNQVHQWAHMRQPPRWVAWLQRRGLVLSRAAHARHHRAPHVVNFCIATGWCNRPLQAIQFFPRLESVVRWCTGLQPRADDSEFAAEHSAVPRPTDTLHASEINR